ncbi:MAG: hypothetical protein GY938_12710 [Ketobacter sp.]|nr:hypothetical protein [Ketobacter sp.]
MAITWTDDAGTPRTLTGSITGVMTNISTAAKRAITGTLTRDADQVTYTGVFAWDLSAADVATAGQWVIYFVETVSGEAYNTLTLEWSIGDAPTP